MKSKQAQCQGGAAREGEGVKDSTHSTQVKAASDITDFHTLVTIITTSSSLPPVKHELSLCG